MGGGREGLVTRISLLLGADHDCPYLPGVIAQSAFVSPDYQVTKSAYSALVAQGFRRSGSLIYRPHCRNCSACLPTRVSASAFRPTRSQRRVLTRNQDLKVVVMPAAFTDEHYDLFIRYQADRHNDGSMAGMSKRECAEFLEAPWGGSRFIEFRDMEWCLMAVAVVDELTDGLSAVYTFFDPALPQRGLGNLAVIWQLAEVRRRGLSWVYLGFWIEACAKMSYKKQFRPMQILSAGEWLNVAHERPIITSSGTK